MARARLTSTSALAAAVSSLALAVLVPGCGRDEERTPPKEPPARGETTPSDPTASAPSATAPPSDAERPPGGAERRRANPESQPGGAGDEEAARAPAMFSGRGGRITPRVVRVPPFLAVRVELRSVDGQEYGLRFGRRELRDGRSLELAGLRPGTRLKGVPVGAGNAVVIEASAEPGP